MSEEITIFNSRKTPVTFTDTQKHALEEVLQFLQGEDQFFLLAGYSGTGKTTIAENIANYTKAHILAPTNAALNRLRFKIDNEKLTFATLHSCLFGAGKEDSKGKVMFTAKDDDKFESDVVLIDECSMIDKYVLDTIIKTALEEHTKIIFLGDSFQLPPVGENPNIFNWEKSMIYRKHFKAKNKIELTEVMRYDGVLLNVATEMRTHKKAQYTDPKSDLITVVPKFSSELVKDVKANGKYIVLTSTNKMRVKYNKAIRALKHGSKDLPGAPCIGDKIIAINNSAYFNNGEQFEYEDMQLLQEFHIAKKNAGESYTAYLFIGKFPMVFIPYFEEASLMTNKLADQVKTIESDLNKEYLKEFIIKEYRSRGTKYERANKELVIATYGFATSCHKS